MFNDEDVKALVEFSQFIGEKADFEVNTKEMIRYVGLMKKFQEIVGRMQQGLVTVQHPEHDNAMEDPALSEKSKPAAEKKSRSRSSK